MGQVVVVTCPELFHDFMVDDGDGLLFDLSVSVQPKSV